MNVVIMIYTCGGGKEQGSGIEIYPFNPLISIGTNYQNV